jgi:malonate transporter
MITLLLNSLVPIFAVMGLGYFAGRSGYVDNHHVLQLNVLVMDFALPASLFVATASTSRIGLIEEWPLLVVLVVSTLALYALCYWMQRRLFGLGSSEASGQTLTIALPNYAAALPLIAPVLGPTHTIDVALAVAAGSIMLSPLTLAVLEGNKAPTAVKRSRATVLLAIGHSLLKPIVLGPLAGIVFRAIGVSLPETVSRSFELIGQAAAGVALFLTGLILSAQSIELRANVVSGTVLKNIVHPLLAVGLILMLPIARDTARAAVILCALPSGFLGVLFELRYGLNVPVAGSTLLVSSLASTVTLTIALVLTAGWS